MSKKPDARNILTKNKTKFTIKMFFTDLMTLQIKLNMKILKKHNGIRYKINSSGKIS